jgi:hypothetical protein
MADQGMSAADVAEKVGATPLAIERQLRGEDDISLGRVAEFAWATGRSIVFELPAEMSASSPAEGRAGNPATDEPLQFLSHKEGEGNV